MITAKRGVGRHNDAYGTVHPRKLFNGGDILDVAHSGSAELRRKDHTQETQLAEFLDRGHGELAGLVPFHDIGRDFALGKLAHTLLELKLFVVKLEIQSSSAELFIRT